MFKIIKEFKEKMSISAFDWCLQHEEFGQQIIDEFDTEENEKIGIRLEDVSYGSNKKVYWKCRRGHKWKAIIGKRTTAGCGCPYCKSNRISFPESFIYYALESVISNIERNYKMPMNLGGLELDICLPDQKLVIEYDGSKWHTEPIDGAFPVDSKEYYKSEICDQYGLRLIHIYDKSKIPNPVLKNNIIFYKYSSSNCNRLKEIVRIILQQINKEDAYDSIDFERVIDKASLEKKTVKLEDSLAFNFQDIAAEWDYKRNVGIKPEMIKPHSNYKAHWICEKGHRWEAAVGARTSKNRNGCPVCAGKQILEGYNDLQTKVPELAKEWHPKLNNLKPTEVTMCSGKRVHWQCTKCGYGENGEWQAVISRRTAKGYESGCPHCKYNYFTKKYHRYVNVHRTVAI